jgi:hypothetical protein
MSDHTVEDVRPEVFVPVRARQQCCVPVAISTYGRAYISQRKANYERRGWDWANCGHTSSFIIDGKPYCKLHAGHRALEILIEDTGADKFKRDMRESGIVNPMGRSGRDSDFWRQWFAEIQADNTEGNR